MQSGNTANFNKPLGDGYNIGNLVRQGGSTMNFGSGVSNPDRQTILAKSEMGNASAYFKNMGSTSMQQSLAGGMLQSGGQAISNMGLMNLYNYLGTVDLKDGNTANFNQPLGDGYSINTLEREGGSNVNFGTGMTTSQKDQILDKSIQGDAAAFDNTSDPA